jgi:cyclophilin family peptidyl-prolyl cis-trans isomerase
MIQGGDPQGDALATSVSSSDEFHPSLKFDQLAPAMANADRRPAAALFITESHAAPGRAPHDFRP